MTPRIESSFRALIQEVEQQEQTQAAPLVAGRAPLDMPPVPTAASAVSGAFDPRAAASAEAKRIASGSPSQLVNAAVLSGRLDSTVFRAELRTALKEPGMLAKALAGAAAAQLVGFCVALCDGSSPSEREALVHGLQALAAAEPATLKSEAARTAVLRMAFFPTHGEALVARLDPKLFTPADLDEYRRENAVG